MVGCQGLVVDSPGGGGGGGDMADDYTPREAGFDCLGIVFVLLGCFEFF
eukprot:SAG31_NODE_10395_length_1143_cov_2.895594_2_plen_48_part_01